MSSCAPLPSCSVTVCCVCGEEVRRPDSAASNDEVEHTAEHTAENTQKCSLYQRKRDDTRRGGRGLTSVEDIDRAHASVPQLCCWCCGGAKHGRNTVRKVSEGQLRGGGVHAILSRIHYRAHTRYTLVVTQHTSTHTLNTLHTQPNNLPRGGHLVIRVGIGIGLGLGLGLGLGRGLGRTRARGDSVHGCGGTWQLWHGRGPARKLPPPPRPGAASARAGGAPRLAQGGGQTTAASPTQSGARARGR